MSPNFFTGITVITSEVKEGQRTLFVHTLHQRPAPPPRDLERAAARSLRLPGQTSRLLRSVRVLILTVTSRVKTWSKSITRRPHGAVASLLVNPDTHVVCHKREMWNFPQLPKHREFAPATCDVLVNLFPMSGEH